MWVPIVASVLGPPLMVSLHSADPHLPLSNVWKPNWRVPVGPLRPCLVVLFVRLFVCPFEVADNESLLRSTCQKPEFSHI